MISMVVGALTVAFGVTSALQELGVLVLTSYPQPDLLHSLQPFHEDGEALYLAAELAAEIANNDTSMLQGYTLKLVQGDSGCNVPFRAINSFVQPLLAPHHTSDTGERAPPIVGVIGPACSLSALSVSAVSSRSELALINVHLSGTHRLNDRTLYPYAFSVLDSSELTAAAMVSLFEAANWSRVAIFYDTSSEYFSALAQTLSPQISGNCLVVGISVANLLPIHQIQGRFRVVFLLMDTDLLNRVMCTAYRNYMYPTYQYILDLQSLDRISGVEIKFGSITSSCTKNEIQQTLAGAMQIHWQLERPDSDKITSSGLSLQRFQDLYQRKICVNGVNQSSYSLVFFDAAWSLFMALNASLDLVDLSRYGFGQPNVTNRIRDKLLELDFEGLSGRVYFSNITGRVHQNARIFRIGGNATTTLLAHYDRDQNELITNFSFMDIEDAFSNVIITVPGPLLWIMVLLVLLGFLVALLLNVFTCIYRKASSVKASSVYLSQVAFVGCYIHSLSIIFAVLEYGFPNQNTICTAHHLFRFSASVGLTVFLGAICVRLWRVYKIFFHYKDPGKYLSDGILCAVVVILTLLDLVMTIPSFFAKNFEPKLKVIELLETKAQISVILTCEQEQYFLWLFLDFFVSAVLLSAIFTLAIVTRKVPLRNFRTKFIIFMAYTLTCVFPVFVVLYSIFGSTFEEVYVTLRFCIICMFLLSLSIISCAMLFLPPLLHATSQGIPFQMHMH